MRIIVISMSVCLSVCLSVYLSVREDINGDTRAIFNQIFVHLVCGRGSILLRQSDKIPRGRGSFRGLLPDALYSIAFGPYVKTAEPIEMPIPPGMMSWLGPRKSVSRGGDDPLKGEAILGKHAPDKPNTTIKCKLDRSMQRLAQDRGRRLIASVGTFNLDVSIIDR